MGGKIRTLGGQKGPDLGKIPKEKRRKLKLGEKDGKDRMGQG